MKRLLGVLLGICMLLVFCVHAAPVLDTAESAEESIYSDEAVSLQAEEGAVVYEWDFEDGTDTWYNSKNHTVSWENGKLIVTHPTAGGYIKHSAISLARDGIKYLVITARASGGVGGVKFYFNTPESSTGMAEAATASIQMEDSTVFKDYVFDLTTTGQWSGVDYSNCMFQLSGAGTEPKLEIESIRFVNDAYIDDYKLEYHYDIPGTSFTTMGTHTFTKEDDGTVTFADSSNSGHRAVYVPAAKLDVYGCNYKYFVLKVKKDPETIGSVVSTSCSVYHYDSAWTNSNCYVLNDGEYDYYVSTIKATGKITNNMVQLAGIGSINISDIFYTNDISDLGDYVWDFEDGSAVGIASWNSNITTAVANGVMTITRTTGTSGGSAVDFQPKLPLSTTDYPYLVLKVKKANLPGMKVYFYTGGQGIAEARTVSITAPMYSDDSYNYYVFDCSKNSGYIGEINKFAFASNVSSVSYSYDVEEIRIAKSLDFITGSVNKYGWTFDDGTYKGIGNFSGNTDVSVADGHLSVVYANNGASGSGVNVYPQAVLQAEDYPYFVAKVRASDATAEPYQVYIQTKSMSGIAADARTFDPAKYSGITEGYNYYVFDLSTLDNWTGEITRIVLQSSQYGTYYADEYYFTNDVSDITGGASSEETATVEKTALYASGSVTTEGGTVTLNPYVRMTDGKEITEFEDIYYVTDSVNAVVTKNSDGLATVTGKLNGDVNITAVIPSIGTSFTKKLTISGQSDKLAATSLKVMLFGNSIRQHGYHATNWPFTDLRGMASSSKEKDYAHRFLYYIDSKYGEGTAELLDSPQISAFERSIPGTADGKDFTTEMADYVNAAKAAQPDIISVQMGENVSGATQAQYENAVGQLYEALHEACPDSVIIICTPFWGGSPKINGIANISEKYGVPVAELHTLNSPENYAYKNAEGWFLPESASSGVEIHPGDTGMDKIAKLIFEQANIVLSADEPTVYTPAPKSVEIISETTEITEKGGTLALSAKVLPEGAAADVVWSISNENLATVSENGVVTALNNTDGETLTVTATSRYLPSVKDEINITITGQTLYFTVTYDGNAEGVTNVPQPFEYAKEGFTFEGAFPERENYRFLGWSLTPDGEVVESVDVTEDITVYAQWEKAYRWYFDMDGNKEGFVAENGFNEYVLDGVFMAIATDTNPVTGEVIKFVSPKLSLAANGYFALNIRMQNTTFVADTQVTLTVKTTDGNVSFTKAVTSSEFTDYEFVLEGVTGTITGFEFTPTNVDCTINIDSIEFYENPAVYYDANTEDEVTNMPAGTLEDSDGFVALSDTVPARTGYTFLGWTMKADSKLLIDEEIAATKASPVTVYAVWDKNDHWEFDSMEESRILSFTSITDTVFNDGILSFTSTGDNRIELYESHHGYEASSTSGVLEARMKWNTEEPLYSQIFYLTSALAKYNEKGSVKASHSVAASEDFEILTFDFTSTPYWSGTFKKMRLDLLATLGTVHIDYLRFTDSETNIVTGSGTTRTLTYDDAATHIVRKGGKLAPNGGITINGLALSGDIDMTKGYICVTGDIEIADDVPYAIFELDMDEIVVDDRYYMMISGYNKKVEMEDGAKYIVKLADGIGFVTFGNESEVSDTIVYKITADGAEGFTCAPVSTLDEYSARVSGDKGIRFKALVSHAIRNATASENGFEIAEYGFVVSTANQRENADGLVLSEVENGTAVKGIAYSKALSIDKIADETDDGVVIAAVITGIKESKKNYETTIFVRPYITFEGGITIYGNAANSSVYEIALRIADTMPEDAPYADYINRIIEVCK